jgi:F420-non-reducing hydrogenase iron-sulfur subunit
MDERLATANGQEPTIVAFFCNWCTYTAADLAGTSRMKYPPNARVIRVMCSGRIDPQFIMEAFAHGADGVLIGGCHPGDCHYAGGNYKALCRITLLRRMLRDMGIEDERLRLEWISASEGEKVARVISEMVQTLRGLAPLDLPGRQVRWDAELLSHELPHEAPAAAAVPAASDGR